MHSELPFVVAAPGHPSLDGALERFCEGLRTESRWFGRRAAGCAKPSPSLIRRLAATAPGPRLAAVVDGEVIGLARIDLSAPAGPELLVAVAAPWRRQGVALELARALVVRARDAGLERVVLRTSVRGAVLRDLGAALGFHVTDLGQGRLDLIRTVHPLIQSA